MRASIIGRTVTIVRINLLGLAASLFGTAAWFVWPGTAEWWGMGVLSLLFGVAAFRLGVQALGMAWRAWEQDRAVAALDRLGGETKSSQMATTKQLKRMGMLDG